MSKLIEINSYGLYIYIYNVTKWYMFWSRRTTSSLYIIPNENEGKNVNIAYNYIYLLLDLMYI